MNKSMTQEIIKLNTDTEFYKGLQKTVKGMYLFGQEVGKALVPMAKALQNIINSIDQEKLKNFIEGIHKYQQYEPYLDNLIGSLENDTNLSHVNETLSLACLVQLIFENENNLDNLHLFDVIKTDYFDEMFFSKFDEIHLGENFKLRKNIIKEAFKLYELEFYVGCLALLYGQLEGILTDYLIQRNLLIKNGNFYNYLGKEIVYTYKNNNKKTINSATKITGIDNKIIIAANFNEYFEKLDAYKIDSEYKINNDRNDILHGNILDRFTKERCFILIIWLTSIFNFLLTEQKIQESLSSK